MVLNHAPFGTNERIRTSTLKQMKKFAFLLIAATCYLAACSSNPENNQEDHPHGDQTHTHEDASHSHDRGDHAHDDDHHHDDGHHHEQEEFTINGDSAAAEEDHHEHGDNDHPHEH